LQPPLVLLLPRTYTIPVLSWGDEGHEVVALIAQANLTPEAAKRVKALLAADMDNLTQHDIASEATWLTIEDNAGLRERTRQWHFVDIEIVLANQPPFALKDGRRLRVVALK
jgi:hypothetical protein